MRFSTLTIWLGVLCCGALAEFTLPPLPYAPNALEPHIDSKTMELHHGTHHAGYVNRLNSAVSGIRGFRLSNDNLGSLLRNLDTLGLPDATVTAIRKYGGGHWNHMLYWKVMTPESAFADASPNLVVQIARQYGTEEILKDAFLQAAASVFGSGWAWLCADVEYGDLKILTTPNQDNPLMDSSETCEPILGVDVWEHAYYLHYQAGRKDYLKSFWGLINWEEVSIYYDRATWRKRSIHMSFTEKKE